jgi:hypothetical protein
VGEIAPAGGGQRPVCVAAHAGRLSGAHHHQGDYRRPPARGPHGQRPQPADRSPRPLAGAGAGARPRAAHGCWAPFRKSEPPKWRSETSSDFGALAVARWRAGPRRRYQLRGFTEAG